MIGALVAVAIVGSVTVFGGKTRDIFSNAATAVSDAIGG